MSTDVQVRNLNALLLGTGEFAFAPKATSVATAQGIGYIDFGNIVATGLKPKVTTTEHKGSYRGVKRADKTFASDAVIEYQLKCDEWDIEKLKIALFGDDATAFTQAAVAAQPADGFDFTTTAAVINRWYDVLASGVRVRELTLVAITDGANPLTENTDYVVDYKAGRIRFLTAQNSTLTVTVTANAVMAGDTASLLALTPMQNFIQEGMGRLMLFDDENPNKLVYDHTDFGCQVFVDSIADVDGKAIGEITLRVRVTSPVGTVFSAN